MISKIGKNKKMDRMGKKMNIVIEESQSTVSMVSHAGNKMKHVDQTCHQFKSGNQQHDHACMGNMSFGSVSPKNNSSTTDMHVKNQGKNSPSSTTCAFINWKSTSTTTFTSNFIVGTSFYSMEKKHRVLTEKEIIGVLHLSQQNACKKLNCSLSTLKRRFYELKSSFGLEKWPQYFFEIRHLPIFQKIYPMNLQFILNTDE